MLALNQRLRLTIQFEYIDDVRREEEEEEKSVGAVAIARQGTW